MSVNISIRPTTEADETTNTVKHYKSSNHTSISKSSKSRIRTSTNTYKNRNLLNNKRKKYINNNFMISNA